MKSIIQKVKAVLTIAFVVVVAVVVYDLFFKTTTSATPNHAAISLTPFTAKEQRDLIRAQQMQERTADTGPLVALVSATDAQARVLNPGRK